MSEYLPILVRNVLVLIQLFISTFEYLPVKYATQLLWKAKNDHISKNVTQRNWQRNIAKHVTLWKITRRCAHKSDTMQHLNETWRKETRNMTLRKPYVSRRKYVTTVSGIAKNYVTLWHTNVTQRNICIKHSKNKVVKWTTLGLSNWCQKRTPQSRPKLVI